MPPHHVALVAVAQLQENALANKIGLQAKVAHYKSAEFLPTVMVVSLY